MSGLPMIDRRLSGIADRPEGVESVSSRGDAERLLLIHCGGRIYQWISPCIRAA